jgi:polyisoprenyl-teichoic acid--peptidoglycan teichoic acid transferase
MKYKINNRFVKNRIALVFSGILLFIFSFILSYNLLKYIQKNNNQNPPPVKKRVVSADFLGEDKPIGLLIIGHGGEGHPGGLLADALVAVLFDAKLKKIGLVAIPRDTYVELPIRSDKKEFHKINEAFAIGYDDTNYPLKQPEYKGDEGAFKLAELAASQVTGFDINYSIAIDFSSFENLIDHLGGVEVNVPVEFNDNYYPVKGLENESCGKSPEEIAYLTETLSGFELESQFECRYEHLHFEKGLQKIEGSSALKYVRSRHSLEHGGDFARGEREITVLFGIKNKLLSLNALTKTDEIYDDVSGFVKSDINKEIVLDFASLITNPNDYKITEINLGDANLFSNSRNSVGQFILNPNRGQGNFSEINEHILTEMYGEEVN